VVERTVFFVESPRTGAGQDAARVLASWGCKTVILVDRPAKLDQFLIDDYAAIGTQIVECDTTSAIAIVEKARALGGDSIAGLTSVYEYYVAVAAEAAQILGLPSADPVAVRRCRSKVMTREACSKDHALNPRFALASDAQDAVTSATIIGLPVVVKPVDLTGSVFVRRCDSGEEVERVASHILSVDKYLGSAMTHTVAVEEYLEGAEFSVECFGGRALGVTAKTSGALPYFVELAHQFPARIEDNTERLIIDTAERALDAVGLTWGPAHVEVKFSDVSLRTPRLVEVNPRVGGDRVPELVRLALGVDLIAMHMAAVVGRDYDGAPVSSPMGGAAIRFVQMPDKGRLTSISGVENAQQSNEVTEVHIKNKVGDVYRSHGSNRDRVAHVIATGPDSEAALMNATRGAEQLLFEWAEIEGEAEYV